MDPWHRPATAFSPSYDLGLADADLGHRCLRTRPTSWSCSADQVIAIGEMVAQGLRCSGTGHGRFDKGLEVALTEPGRALGIGCSLLQIFVEKPELCQFQVEHLFTRCGLLDAKTGEESQECPRVFRFGTLGEIQSRRNVERLGGLQYPVSEVGRIRLALGRREESVPYRFDAAPVGAQHRLVPLDP